MSDDITVIVQPSVVKVIVETKPSTVVLTNTGTPGAGIDPVISGSFDDPNLIAEAGVIPVAAGYNKITYIAGDGAAVSAGGIAPGIKDGEVLEVVFCDDDDTVAIDTMTGISQNGEIIGKSYWSIFYRWVLATEVWRETNRSIRNVDI